MNCGVDGGVGGFSELKREAPGSRLDGEAREVFGLDGGGTRDGAATSSVRVGHGDSTSGWKKKRGK
jgi:hypothetical protein